MKLRDRLRYNISISMMDYEILKMKSHSIKCNRSKTLKMSQRLSSSYFNMLKRLQNGIQSAGDPKLSNMQGSWDFLKEIADGECLLIRMRWKLNAEKIPRPIQTSIKQELAVCKGRTCNERWKFLAMYFWRPENSLSSLMHRLQWCNWWIRSEWDVGQRARCM